MKFHKVRGIDKSVCTAEQKIAYNYASSYSDIVIKSGMKVQDFLKLVLNNIERDHSDFKKKYNVDGIIYCLEQGIINYCESCKSGHSILWEYKEIGKMFPSLYPIE